MSHIPLDKLFTIVNGLPSSVVDRSPYPRSVNWIPYLRPSNRQESSIDAYVNRQAVPANKVFPKGTLYVSTDGQGSHSYAYVSVSEFVPNSNICVLLPIEDMSLNEKLYYALCITSNRFKFSYGRKPKGDRLAKILLPERGDFPVSFKGVDIGLAKQKLQQTIDFEELGKRSDNQNVNDELVPLESLFDVENGIASTEVYRIPYPKSANWIPYLRPSHRQATSIDAYVNRYAVPQNKVFPKGTLYVSTDGQGSHSYAYVSVSDFVPNSNISVLIPRCEMCLREKLAYALFITANRFKFSYGRKPKGDRLKAIMLPASIPEAWNNADLEKQVNLFSSVE